MIGISAADAASWNDLRASLAAPLQKVEDNNFFFGAVFAFSFSVSAEIVFIELDFAIEGFVGFAGCFEGR